MEKKRYNRYEIPASGGTQAVNVASNEETIVLHGDNTLTSSYTLAPAGTAEYGMSLNVLYVADMILNGNNITIFGNTLTTSEAISNMEIRLFYDGTSWNIVKKIHNDDASLDIGDIDSESLNGDAIIPATLYPEKLVQTGADKLIKGDGSGSSEELQISTSNIVSAYDGELKSATVGGVFTASYNDTTGELEFSMNPDIVGMDELDDITRGSIVRGGAGNVPEIHDCKTDGYLLGGTGTDAKSMEVGGDVEFSYDSADDKLNARVKSIKSENELATTSTVSGIPKTYIWDDLAGSGLLDGISHSIYTAPEGNIIVSAKLYGFNPY